MSTAQLAERFGAVSMTLEMPFKDNEDLPDPVYGWSPERSRLLARSCLDALHASSTGSPTTATRSQPDAPPRPDPPRPVGLEPGEPLHRLVGRRPHRAGRARRRGGRRAARRQGLRLRHLLHQRADAGDQDAAHRARGDGPAVAARSRRTGGSTSAIMAASPASTRPRPRPGMATSRSISGAARSTSRRRRSSRAASSTSPATGAMPASRSRRTESLKDTIARVLPYWEERIAPALRAGERVLISAHGNSLRALVKHLSNIPDDEITGARNPDRPADRLRAGRGAERGRALLSEGSVRAPAHTPSERDRAAGSCRTVSSKFLDPLEIALGAARGLPRHRRRAGWWRRRPSPARPTSAAPRSSGWSATKRAIRSPVSIAESGSRWSSRTREAGAGAGGDVAGADQALEQPGDMGERGVAGDAAVALVDQLEALDVDR